MNHTCSRATLCLLAIACAFATPRAQAPLRPEFRGRHGVVAAGRSFAADAGARILAAGGNAIDAGVATVFAAAVVEISHFGLGGEAPMIIYSARDREVVVINGQGTAPRAANPQMFAADRAIPGNGPLGGTVPAVVDAAALALARYGTRSLSDVLAPAIELADGFPMYEFLRGYLESERKRSEPYAWTMRTYYPDGRVTPTGEMFRQPNLARTLRALADAERTAASGGASREQAIRAGRDAFYKSDIARRIAAATREAGGVLTEEDLASYQGKIEKPLSVSYRGYQVVQGRSVESGAGSAADARAPRGFQPACDGRRISRRRPYDRRSRQARLRRSRQVLRRPGLRAGADGRPSVHAVHDLTPRIDRPGACQPRATARAPGRNNRNGTAGFGLDAFSLRSRRT